jgi:hypothetical protein
VLAGECEVAPSELHQSLPRVGEHRGCARGLHDPPHCDARDLVEQVLLVSEVEVDGGRRVAEPRGEGAHGDALDPLGLDDLDRLGEDPLAQRPGGLVGTRLRQHAFHLGR